MALGKPVELDFPFIEEISAVLELAQSEEVQLKKRLNFNTAYKISRLKKSITKVTDFIKKKKDEIIKEIRIEGPDGKVTINNKLYSERIKELNLLKEVIFVPEFKLSEFIEEQVDEKTKKVKETLLVPMIFIQTLNDFIIDDKVAYVSEEEEEKEVEELKRQIGTVKEPKLVEDEK